MSDKILIIGASGQIGSELTMELRNVYPPQNVFATDIKDAAEDVMSSGPFSRLDAMDEISVSDFISRNKITQVYLLAAILSGNAEKNPQFAWELNMKSLLMILNFAKEGNIKKIFWPSSIAVFGPTTPKENTPQLTVTEPSTVYGISKFAGERWCEYYFRKHSVDVRSIRYPGLISYKVHAGGGTTDYAVDIFYKAIEQKQYTCFLKKDTVLPMMYMPDATRGTIELMEADASNLSIRSSYNLSAFSFSPEELAKQIQTHIPEFKMDYDPDFRQAIADSWPRTIDDKLARADWGWSHKYDLAEMTSSMLNEISKKQNSA